MLLGAAAYKMIKYLKNEETHDKERKNGSDRELPCLGFLKILQRGNFVKYV